MKENWIPVIVIDNLLLELKSGTILLLMIQIVT